MRTGILFISLFLLPIPLFAAKKTSVGAAALVRTGCTSILDGAEIVRLGKSLERFVVDRPFQFEDFLNDFPSLVRSAKAVGLGKSELLRVLHSFLDSRESPYWFDRPAKMLQEAFQAIGILKTDLKNHIDALEKMVSLRQFEYAIRDLPLALRHGWTPEQYVELVTLLQATQARLEDRIYLGMPHLLRTMIAYGVDPQISFRAMKSLFKDQEVEFVIAELPGMIEVAVLRFGLSPNRILEEIPNAMGPKRRAFPSVAVGKAFSNLVPEPLKLLSEGEIQALAMKEFPLIPGPVRHSQLLYRVKRSFEAGIQDLLELARAHIPDQDHEEGAFVFDPLQETWYSLAGKTTVDFENRKISTAFADQDISALSSAPRFVHIHPKSLTSLHRMPKDSLADEYFREAIELFPSILPSRADIKVFAGMISGAQKPMNPEFIIVHSLGTTTIHLGKDLKQVQKLGEQLLALRDAVVLDPSHNLKALRNKTTKEVLDFLIDHLNKRLSGHITIQLNPSFKALE